jgi:hypothetical protein
MPMHRANARGSEERVDRSVRLVNVFISVHLVDGRSDADLANHGFIFTVSVLSFHKVTTALCSKSPIVISFTRQKTDLLCTLFVRTSSSCYKASTHLPYPPLPLAKSPIQTPLSNPSPSHNVPPHASKHLLPQRYLQGAPQQHGRQDEVCESRRKIIGRKPRPARLAPRQQRRPQPRQAV